MLDDLDLTKPPPDFERWPPMVRAIWLRRMTWLATARSKQVTPEGNWMIWLLLAGRGFGKTRVGAEDAVHFCLSNPGVRQAVIAPTSRDLRLVCFEGESGIAAITPPELLAGGSWSRAYNVTTAEIEFANGSKIEGFSAQEPERLRGPQFHRAWCDELAAWERLEQTWSMLRFCLRLGKDPKTVATTTPKPLPLLFELVKDANVHVTSGTTYENEDHLAASFLEEMGRYEGTELGRQEIHAELIDFSQKAILKRHWWKRWDGEEPPVCDRRIMAIDTAFSDKQQNDPSACLVTGRFLDELNRPNLYSMQGWNEHLEFNPLVSAIIDTAKAYRPQKILIENRASGPSVIQELRRRTDLPIHVWNPKGDKKSRAHAVSPILQSGIVHLPKGRSWVTAMVDECAMFPNARHDDWVDVVTMTLEYMRLMGAAVLGDETDPLAFELDNYKTRLVRRVVSYY